jgi:hypothetical protein
MIYKNIIVALMSICGQAAFADSVSKNIPIIVTHGSTEEFVGPFANWINAKTGKRYDATGSSLCTSAVGDGTTDDSAAIQSCINALGPSNSVLWLPASTYAVGNTLALWGLQNVSLIGADPATTGFKWIGPTQAWAQGSTSNANDFIFAVYGWGNTPSPTAGTGWTAISGADYQLTEYKIVSATQTNLGAPVGGGAVGSGDITAGVMDAIVQSGTIALDGSAHNHNFSSNASIAATLTTTSANDIIEVTVSLGTLVGTPTVSSTHTTGWVQRGFAASKPGSSGTYVFRGKASSALTAEVITVSYTSASIALMDAFGISGANTTTPQDANPSLPALYKNGYFSASLLGLNGVAYSRVDRLTFDANATGRALINQAYDGSTGAFDTGNEYADDVVKNGTGYGYACGFNNNGCAESALLRDTFSGMSYEAVSLGNSNALDIWCWYCTFTNNGDGMANADGAGNFSAFKSVFTNSNTADVFIGNTGLMSFDWNYSSGSNRFVFAGGTSNPSNLTLQGNTVLDTTQSSSVSNGNFGPVVMIDNNIRSLLAATAPIITGSSADIFSTGNNYTVASPVGGFRSHSISDNVLSIAAFNAAVNTAPPTLPGTPPNNSRTIFEVAPGASTATIQAAINSAVAAGPGSVVHLQGSGSAFSITSTLLIPASAFIQIIGDGFYSQLTWAGSSGPVIQCAGLCLSVFRDFKIDGNSHAATGIIVTNADRPGARVFVEQLFTSFNSGAGLLSNALDYTTVEVHDSQFSANVTGVKVVGGASAAGGTWLGGTVNIYAAAGFGSGKLIDLSNNAHLAGYQVWNDADGLATANTIAALSGTGGALSIAGMSAFENNSNTATHTISLSGFTGTAALLNISSTESTLAGDVAVSGSAAGGNVLAVGYVGLTAAPFADTTSPADTNGFLNGLSTSCVGLGTCPGQGAGEVAESGTSTSGFVNTALTQLRSAQPTPSGALAPGLYRIAVQNAINGLDVEH